MNEIVRYLLQSSVCLGALYLVYAMFLRQDTFFIMNRIYLLLVILFSITIPLVPVRFALETTMAPIVILLEPVLITPEKIDALTARHLSWVEAFGIVYLTGLIIFTIRFIVQVIQLMWVIHRNGITRHEKMNLVLVDKGYSPFSFFNLVFIRREVCGLADLSAILRHEQVHIRQRHSIDLILAELLTIVLWFNPFSWLIQRSIKSLHEYLADEGVLKCGIRKQDYQQLIFSQTLGKQLNNLTNNFNVSLIQKRIIMMTKSRSNPAAKMKLMFALPVLLLTLFFFSSSTFSMLSAQDQTTKTNQLNANEKQFKSQQEKASQADQEGNQLIPSTPR